MAKVPALQSSAFQALFETAPDAMIVIDGTGRIVLANPQSEGLFGYPAAGLQGLLVEALVPEAARGRHQAHRASYAARPRVTRMGTGQELVGLRHDGSQFAVEIALSPIETEAERFYVASIRDISETQRARHVLIRARYDALVAQVGRLVLESPSDDIAFENILGLITKELSVDAIAIVFIQPQSRAIQVRAAVGFTQKLLVTLPIMLAPENFSPAPNSNETVAFTVDSLAPAQSAQLRSLLDVAGFADLIAVPLFDRSRPMGALIKAAHQAATFDRDKIHFLQSVANLLAASVQRSRSEEQLAHVQRLDAVGQLTGGIAHDFNNLLTVISGNLQLLETELEDRPQTQEILASALRAVGRGAELTRKLLAFARRQRLNPCVIDPRQQVNELIPMLARTLGEMIKVEVEYAAALPNVFVDPAELDAAILNLALNARDAMLRGGILHILVRTQSFDVADAGLELAPGNYVVIEVRDTGLGMAPDVLARAFEPFFTTKEVGRGSGLGLSMVYGFVKQSGGHLSAQSRLGYGTRVELYLPAAQSSASIPPKVVATLSSGGKEAILVVEDEAEVRRIAIAFLRSLGYSTYEAVNAEQALLLLQTHADIELLFTDVILGSGKSGVELAREAQQIRPDLPVLLTSGYEHPIAAADGTVPILAALLRKPYRREDLAAAVRREIDQPQ